MSLREQIGLKVSRWMVARLSLAGRVQELEAERDEAQRKLNLANGTVYLQMEELRALHGSIDGLQMWLDEAHENLDRAHRWSALWHGRARTYRGAMNRAQDAEHFAYENLESSTAEWQATIRQAETERDAQTTQAFEFSAKVIEAEGRLEALRSAATALDSFWFDGATLRPDEALQAMSPLFGVLHDALFWDGSIQPAARETVRLAADWHAHDMQWVGAECARCGLTWTGPGMSGIGQCKPRPGYMSPAREESERVIIDLRKCHHEAEAELEALRTAAAERDQRQVEVLRLRDEELSAALDLPQTKAWPELLAAVRRLFRAEANARQAVAFWRAKRQA